MNTRFSVLPDLLKHIDELSVYRKEHEISNLLELVVKHLQAPESPYDNALVRELALILSEVLTRLTTLRHISQELAKGAE